MVDRTASSVFHADIGVAPLKLAIGLKDDRTAVFHADIGVAPLKPASTHRAARTPPDGHPRRSGVAPLKRIRIATDENE